jgi:hypothetical protein
VGSRERSRRQGGLKGEEQETGWAPAGKMRMEIKEIKVRRKGGKGIAGGELSQKVRENGTIFKSEH